MSDSTTTILENKEVIAVDQDWGGMQGHKVRDDGELDAWVKPMSSGDKAVVLLNRGTTTFEFTVQMTELELSGGTHQVRDLWAHKTTSMRNEIHVTLAGHSASMFIVKKQVAASAWRGYGAVSK